MVRSGCLAFSTKLQWNPMRIRHTLLVTLRPAHSCLSKPMQAAMPLLGGHGRPSPLQGLAVRLAGATRCRKFARLPHMAVEHTLQQCIVLWRIAIGLYKNCHIADRNMPARDAALGCNAIAVTGHSISCRLSSPKLPRTADLSSPQQMLPCSEPQTLKPVATQAPCPRRQALLQIPEAASGVGDL